jgi:hypothetical protein
LFHSSEATGTVLPQLEDGILELKFSSKRKVIVQELLASSNISIRIDGRIDIPKYISIGHGIVGIQTVEPIVFRDTAGIHNVHFVKDRRNAHIGCSVATMVDKGQYSWIDNFLGLSLKVVMKKNMQLEPTKHPLINRTTVGSTYEWLAGKPIALRVQVQDLGIRLLIDGRVLPILKQLIDYLIGRPWKMEKMRRRVNANIGSGRNVHGRKDSASGILSHL